MCDPPRSLLTVVLDSVRKACPCGTQGQALQVWRLPPESAGAQWWQCAAGRPAPCALVVGNLKLGQLSPFLRAGKGAERPTATRRPRVADPTSDTWPHAYTSHMYILYSCINTHTVLDSQQLSVQLYLGSCVRRTERIPAPRRRRRRRPQTAVRVEYRRCGERGRDVHGRRGMTRKPHTVGTYRRAGPDAGNRG